MCGVIGVYLEKVTPAQIEKVKELIVHSSIRGVHATGISYFRNGRIQTVKEHGPPQDFFKYQNLEGCIDDAILCLIAHTRYSTSDLRFNQPLGNGRMAICHNGVISQSSPEHWKDEFNLITKTSNDSELILQCLNGGQHPLTKFKGSMAVCGITDDKELFAFRNHERPLWYCQENNGVIFASTKDILVRAGFENPHKCDMFTEYVMREGILTHQLYPTPAGVKDLQ